MVSAFNVASSRPGVVDRYDAGLLLLCGLYLYANLFAGTTPYLLSGDQVFFWVDAQRLLHGEQIYRDFFQFTSPGTDLVYWGVFTLWGPQIWTTNLVVLMVCFSLCLVCLRITRSVLPRAAAALATLLYLVLVLGLTLNATHHLFSALAVFVAVTLLIDGQTTTKTLLAGVLVGAASFFTQTRGPVAGAAIAVWLMIDGRRRSERRADSLQRVAILLATALLTWLALSGYYLKNVGLRTLWFFQVEYVRHYLVSTWSMGMPNASSTVELIKWLFSFVALPLIYLAALWRCCRASRSSNPQQGSRVLLLAMVGTALYLEVIPGPSWLRFFSVALPGVILLIWLLRQSDKIARYSLTLLCTGVIGFGLEQTWSKHRLNCVQQRTPAGTVATTALNAQKLSWLEAHTSPEDFFLQTQWPGLYLPLALRNPVYLDLIISPGADALGYTAVAIRQVEARRVRYIEWSPRLDRPGYTLGTFHAFLIAHYQPIQTFPDGDEIWERSERD